MEPNPYEAPKTARLLTAKQRSMSPSYAHVAFFLAAVITLLFGGYFFYREWESEHRTFFAIVIGSQFAVAVLGLGYVLFSPKEESSKDVQILRGLAFTLPFITASAMREFYPSWLVPAIAWAASEMLILLLLIRPLNPLKAFRNKGEPKEPPLESGIK